MSYDHRAVEPKWQSRWKEANLHRTPDDPGKPNYYALDMFPYPSGAGLHVGHCEGYTATDIITRWKRMQGWNVLHPMGWDAFGLPAENYAIKHGVHPRITTAQAIANFRRQIDAVGFAYDWEREINTTDPAYVKWTQWIFLQLFKRDLAYRGRRRPSTGARRQDRPRQRRGLPGPLRALRRVVERKDMRQWMLRITRYADRCSRTWRARLARVDGGHAAQLDRPQRGRRGRVHDGDAGRGARDPRLHDAARHAVRRDVHGARARAPAGRRADDAGAARGGRGVPGAGAAQERPRAHRPRQGEDRRASPARRRATRSTASRVPIWIADYVLASYGTGAIMAVPAHDERDFAFATEVQAADRPRRHAAADGRTLNPDDVLHRRRRRRQLGAARRHADGRGEERRHRTSSRRPARASRR